MYSTEFGRNGKVSPPSLNGHGKSYLLHGYSDTRKGIRYPMGGRDSEKAKGRGPTESDDSEDGKGGEPTGTAAGDDINSDGLRDIRVSEYPCNTEGLASLEGAVGRILRPFPGDGEPNEVFAWQKEVFKVTLALQRLGRADLDEQTLGLLREWHGRLESPKAEWFDLEIEVRVAWPKVVEGVCYGAWPDSTEPMPQKAQQFAQDPLMARLIHGLRFMGRGGKPFDLSCRVAAERLGMTGKNDFVKANRMLQVLGDAGLLQVENMGSTKRVPGKSCMTATTWVWTGDEPEE